MFLKKHMKAKDVDSIKTALDGINEAWKNASEELYKAQAEAQQASGAGPKNLRLLKNLKMIQMMFKMLISKKLNN